MAFNVSEREDGVSILDYFGVIFENRQQQTHDRFALFRIIFVLLLVHHQLFEAHPDLLNYHFIQALTVLLGLVHHHLDDLLETEHDCGGGVGKYPNQVVSPAHNVLDVKGNKGIKDLCGNNSIWVINQPPNMRQDLIYVFNA